MTDEILCKCTQCHTIYKVESKYLDDIVCPKCKGYLHAHGYVEERRNRALKALEEINNAKPIEGRKSDKEYCGTVSHTDMREIAIDEVKKLYVDGEVKYGVDYGNGNDFTSKDLTAVVIIRIDTTHLQSDLESINKQLKEAFERFKREGIKVIT